MHAQVDGLGALGHVDDLVYDLVVLEVELLAVVLRVLQLQVHGAVLELDLRVQLSAGVQAGVGREVQVARRAQVQVLLALAAVVEVLAGAQVHVQVALAAEVQVQVLRAGDVELLGALQRHVGRVRAVQVVRVVRVVGLESSPGVAGGAPLGCCTTLGAYLVVWWMPDSARRGCGRSADTSQAASVDAHSASARVFFTESTISSQITASTQVS